MKNLKESIIDYPKPELCLAVWAREGGEYTLKAEVEAKIKEMIANFKQVDLMGLLGDLRVVGSIGTNLYRDDTDIDVHLNPDPKKLAEVTDDAEGLQAELKRWIKENHIYVDEHPIDIYLQLNPYQDYMSDSLYDIEKKDWVKGPLLVPDDYDPYKVYSGIYDEVVALASATDAKFGELKRDVIDYEVMQDAMRTLPPRAKKELYKSLKNKFDEVEHDIDDLLKNKKEWLDMRKAASAPITTQQALHDVELAKEWKEGNAVFKLLDRYQYFKLITALENMMKDDEIDPSEFGEIKKMLGVLKVGSES